MRKRDALKKALKCLLRRPKFSEWEKLFYAGFSALFGSVAMAIILVFTTRSGWWILLVVVGILLYCWFIEAGEILQDEEWKEK